MIINIHDTDDNKQQAAANLYGCRYKDRRDYYSTKAELRDRCCLSVVRSIDPFVCLSLCEQDYCKIH